MSDIQKVVDLFGTQGNVAKAAGLSFQSSVGRWIENSSIPHKRRIALLMAAPDFGVDPTQLLDLLIGEYLIAHIDAMSRVKK